MRNSDPLTREDSVTATLSASTLRETAIFARFVRDERAVGSNPNSLGKRVIALHIYLSLTSLSSLTKGEKRKELVGFSAVRVV